jgi:hypothetical protein
MCGEVVFQGSVGEGEAVVVLELDEMTAVKLDTEFDSIVEASSENFGGDGLAGVLCCGFGQCVGNPEFGKLQAFLLEDGPPENLLDKSSACRLLVYPEQNVGVQLVHVARRISLEKR